MLSCSPKTIRFHIIVAMGLPSVSFVLVSETKGFDNLNIPCSIQIKVKKIEDLGMNSLLLLELIGKGYFEID